jgi:hypothetical protein
VPPQQGMPWGLGLAALCAGLVLASAWLAHARWQGREAHNPGASHD